MQGRHLGILLLDKHGERLHASGRARDFCVAEEVRARLAQSASQSASQSSSQLSSLAPESFRLSTCPSLVAQSFATDDAICVVFTSAECAPVPTPRGTAIEARGTDALDMLVGVSDAITRLKRDILRVAPLDVPVLLTGESGTGKDLVARAIHALSRRQSAEIVIVNAAALPATLVESELFGYAPGAFTGAERKGRKGKFEQADGGTLFLDEMGEVPGETQVKLLRVLQDGVFERVGAEQSLRSDFRLICATNCDLPRMLDSGAFRLDLYYRISAVTMEVPPLRERLEDIPVLLEHFLQAFATRHGGRKRSVQDGVIQYLQSLPWPGNVRQLQHAVERASIFAEGDVITSANFGALMHQMPVRAASSRVVGKGDCASLKSAREQVESEVIRDALRRVAGNKKKAAAELGISRSYLYKRLDELDL